jgi:ADP-ribose pyrophosphatase
MRRLLEKLGIIVFFLAWPAFYIYLKRSERTRIIIAEGNKVLVTRNWISDGKWSLPGGGLHQKEPILQGAQRELFEETGLRVSQEQLRYVGKQTYRNYGHTFVFHTFVARDVDMSDLRRQKHEISRTAWISPANLTERNTAQDARKALDLWLHQ